MVLRKSFLIIGGRRIAKELNFHGVNTSYTSAKDFCRYENDNYNKFTDVILGHSQALSSSRNTQFNNNLIISDLLSKFISLSVKKKYFFSSASVYGTQLSSQAINENCELTHVVRYNHQLGLNAEFLRQDITEPDFLDNFLQKIGDKKIDVVCGGPPCQSFSLAGKRKKFDKKDDLFSHYLEVIKILQPKYFVMENVKGILTKEQGKIKDLIIQEINSIVDTNEIPVLVSFIRKMNFRF